MSDINSRLAALRALMQRKRVAAVIIPGTDPHQSEYVSPHWQLREWLSGFTGSNGTAVVTRYKACLWTDSRYFLQAEQQLKGTDFELHREGIPGEDTIEEWLAKEMEENDILAVDGRLFSIIAANRLDVFCGENGLMFAPTLNIAEELWPDRPPRPMTPVFVHDEQYAGESLDSKVRRTLEAVAARGARSLLVTALDEIAWLFNLRGSDVDFTPVTVAYAFISPNERVLFIDSEKVGDDVRNYLRDNDVELQPYDDVSHFLEHLREREVVLLDPHRVSDALAQSMMCGNVYGTSPITALKAVKNDVQIAGIREAMVNDGAALVRLFRWIESAVPEGGVTELDVWERGKQERARCPLYRTDSFAMIAGYREHGAIVHYEADEESASTLAPYGLLLVDSGAQYLNGTTDITRTITLGNPTAEEIHDYTLVLKGHLALARAQFPIGICGVHLDALARMPLWKEGMGYLHGTGHGVGHFLGCHEGPHSIRTDLNATPLEAGMITSDEPGLYKAGRYGIRIENLLLVTEGDSNEEFGDFLRFEPLTLFPYDNRLIDRTMLTDEEVKQINDYHALVRSSLTPLLTPEEQAWLEEKTHAI